MPRGLTYLPKSDKNGFLFQVLPSKTYASVFTRILPLTQHQEINQHLHLWGVVNSSASTNTQSIFLNLLVQGNTSTFICMGADLARRAAITSSFSFAAPHIRDGITQRGLWRVWPSPLALFSPPPNPFSAAFDVSAWSRTERRGLPGLTTSSDPICSGGTFMWFTPATGLPAAIQLALQAPPWSGSRGLRQTRHGLENSKNWGRIVEVFVNAQGCTAELMVW